MKFPEGSIQGLCLAAAAGFAIGIGFLVYWGYQINTPWEPIDLFVLVPLLTGSVLLAITPFTATGPYEEPLRWARRMFLAGILLIWVAVVFAVLISAYLAGADFENGEGFSQRSRVSVSVDWLAS